MRDQRSFVAAVMLAALAAGCSRPQPPAPPSDLLGLATLKDFSAERVSSNNPDLASNDDSLRPIAGETVVLADLTGPGVVTHIWLTVAANEYAWPRLLRLRVYYDGSDRPSVDAPVGDFFGVGHGFEREVESLAVRDSSSGRSRNSYWAMPFRKSCRITITNEGRRRVSNLYYHVDWKRMPGLPPDTAYFHALYRQALPTAMGAPYTLLDVKGRGHYVGTVLSVIQNQPGWFGEGDDFFYVDGAPKASIEGTGTEDYFNDAWSLRVATGPYAGVPVADGTGLGSRMTAYRWHLMDPIPFRRSLRFDIEHKGWTFNADGSVRSAFEERADLFSSVAFWYQDGIAADQPTPPFGAARLPLGNAQQIEVETALDQTHANGGRASVQKEVFWSKDLLFFDAAGPGARIEVPFDVAADGTYELTAQLAHSPDYGIYSVLIDGKPPASLDLEHEAGANEGGSGPMDLYYTETYVAEDHLLGWLPLTAGRHSVTFVCQGKRSQATSYHLGLDTLILARVPDAAAASAHFASDRAGVLRALGDRRPAGPEDIAQLAAAVGDTDRDVREAAIWALGQQGPRAAQALSAITTTLGDPDLVIRGLAAVALRELGSAAAPALDGLVARLQDDEVGVRMVAADAIAGLGPAARPAFDALVAAGRAPDQHVHVLRSVAKALGAIGPEAEPALPLLREMAKVPRVQWAAEAAMRRIEGR